MRKLRLFTLWLAAFLLASGCYAFTLKDLRSNSIHTMKTVSGDYEAVGTCLSRWLDENTAGARIPRHYPADQLYQIQGPRNSSVGGFITLVELRQASANTVQVDTYVAHDVFLVSSETITERFMRGLGTCVK